MGKSVNIFGLPPGVNFASELLRGIDERVAEKSTALAGSEIWVNTERTRRRILELYHAGHARILPRVRLVTELSPLVAGAVPRGVSALRRQLELRPLVTRLLELQPDLTGTINPTELTDSLAKLLIEMADEGVSPQSLRDLDVSDASGHWQRAQSFLTIATAHGLDPDQPSLQRRIAETLADNWRANPPSAPIFLAGSTGSRGPTGLLMQALAGLENAHVILPGYDFEMSARGWRDLDRDCDHEDHPQFRFRRLTKAIGIAPDTVERWTDAAAPSPDRNRLLSLALRPAPVTDAWMREGPRLDPLGPTADAMTLIEAPTPRAEATAIAVCLRVAVEAGKKSALITPDQALARRVTAALARWGIIPDDSAGRPLDQTPLGRLLMALAEIAEAGLTSVGLVALMSNPLVASGNRVAHLAQLRDLETYLRKSATLRPRLQTVFNWQKTNESADGAWVDWAGNLVQKLTAHQPPASLGSWAAWLIEAAELCASGPDGETPALIWADTEGTKARDALSELTEEGERGGAFSALEFRQFLRHRLSQVQIRDAAIPHPDVMIWGTLEARVQSVDLAILAGLNEGTWPQAPDPDPWLSRGMRRQAGLLSPERRIGLAGHDFQSAAGAPEIVLSRAVRDDDSMNVASRWLNRLTNLMDGLADLGGKEALAAMRARGENWVALAGALDHRCTDTPPAPRPAPAPPVSVRPKRLSVTRIKTLVRDPYAIYASEILGLKPFDPLRPQPDARLRGIMIHKVLERFVSQNGAGGSRSKDQLLDVADAVLASLDEYPAAARLWRRALSGIADDFLAAESHRQALATPTYFEVKGSLSLQLSPQDLFTLSGVADRIDRTSLGQYVIFDYKTGTISKPKQQILFDLQLYLLAHMAEAGAFMQKTKDRTTPVPAGPVLGASFLGFGQNLSEVPADFGALSIGDAVEALKTLLRSYQSEVQGYGARAKMEKSSDVSDFDHLSRRGEWDDATPATLIRLRHDT